MEKIVKARIFILVICVLFLSSCVMTKKLTTRDHNVDISQTNIKSEIEKTVLKQIKSTKKEENVYTIGRYDEAGNLATITLEMDEVIVKGSIRNLAERDGKIGLKFKVTIPKSLQDTYYSVKITPELIVNGRNEMLEPLLVKGQLYDIVYQRQNYFFDLYQQRLLSKSDSSALSEEVINKLKKRLLTCTEETSMRLDTIIARGDNIEFAYTQEYQILEEIKKIQVTLNGEVVSIDESKYKLPPTDTVEYNISSLNKFIDLRPRYIEEIISKYETRDDKRFLMFKEGKSDIIDTLGNNKVELQRMISLLDSMFLQNEFYIDSIKLIASASPEGMSAYNDELSKKRVNSLLNYINTKMEKKITDVINPEWIGENWDELKKLIAQDTAIKNRVQILELVSNAKPIELDYIEPRIRKKYADDYKYMKENLYPKLRSVTFTYNLRRVGMIQDTVKTTKIDQTYKEAVKKIQDLDYRGAAEIFKLYNDQNYALCLLQLNRNKAAKNVLLQQSETDAVLYLTAIVSMRLDERDKAIEYLKKAIKMNNHLKFRIGLDPEFYKIASLFEKFLISNDPNDLDNIQ